jgi:putative ABC transport system permease protein
MTLAADVRYALRQLLRAPGFTIVALLSLALGIGANTTVFTVANALLFRPLDVPRPDEIVRVYNGHHSPFSFLQFQRLREQTSSFSELIAEEYYPVALQTGTETVRATVLLTSGNLFSALGQSPARGRLFARTDDRTPAAESEVVLSHRFWTSQLGGDPSVVGRLVRLNGSAFRVIGVAAAGFNGGQEGFLPDAFVPLGDTRALLRMVPDSLSGGLYVSGRLKPGMTIAVAEADVMRLARQVAVEAGAADPNEALMRVRPARGITEEGRAPVAVATIFAQVVALLVLLIACANVGNLMLGRSARRRREIGIRLAIGARQRRLVQQFLTEGSVLAVGGAAAALLMTAWVTGLLSGMVPADVPIHFEFAVDARVLLYATGAAVLTVLLFALAPALVTVRQAAEAVRDDARWASPRGVRLRSVLLMVQIALGSVLLVGALLFARSLARAQTIDPGFPTASLLDVRVELGQGRYTSESGAAFYDRVIGRVRAIPGVAAAAIGRMTPLTGGNSQTTFFREGDPAPTRITDENMVYFNRVGPGYFSTMQIPLVRGREFALTDRAGAPPAVVVNATMARRLWPNESAIGKRVSMQGADGPWLEVVGVARDVKFTSLNEPPVNFLYLASLQGFHDDMVIEVRAVDGTNLGALGSTIGEAVRALDPVIAPPIVRPTAENMRVVLVPARIGASLMAVLGGIAALLAGLGMFGVTSYLVAQRTREIGVRMALGARPAHVLSSVLGGTARLLAIGGAIGVVAALGFGRLIASQLYGVSASDPVTFVAVPLSLAAVALIAGYVPARRALSVDPTIAMRAE